MPAKWPITVDEKRPRVSAGDAHWDCYVKVAWRDLAITTLHANKVFVPWSAHPKDKNKAIADELGITASAFHKVWTACMWKAFIKPIEEEHPFVLENLCKFQRGVKSDWLNLAWDNLETIRQYEKDGLTHLLPFAWKYGVSTQHMKVAVGKSDWKKLCANTFSRNKLLTMRCEEPINLRYANTLRTTFLRKMNVGLGYGCDRVALTTAHNIAESQGKLGRDIFCNQMFRVARDTNRLASALGFGLDDRMPKWSERRLNEEHDNLMHEFNRNRDRIHAEQQKQIELDREDFCESLVETFEWKGVTAELLDSVDKLLDEGQEMGHCVGSYAKSVKDKDYVVYSLKNKEGKRTTLGLCRQGSKVSYNQHYGSRNSMAPSDLEEAAQELITTINSHE